MVRSVVALLQPPAEVDLSHHTTILRLSRDLENRPAIVTTNFDTLIERAFLQTEDAPTVRALSFAGQDLPPPGAAGFGGIIHIHGRIADQAIELEETPLVVTSADYGDAYMRSGWASRFLFDLCRCRTIVLVGYSAGDAPVRYFLNVLEADRQRFPDLRPVYALDAVDAEDGVEGADMRWEALAVTPIPYAYEFDAETERKTHAILWRDLDMLARLVERPKATRREWAQVILAKRFADAEPAELEHLAWLVSGRRDLYDVVIRTVTDPAWLDFLSDRSLWTERDATWIVARWIGREFASAARFRLALKWLERLGKPFADDIAQQLRQTKGLDELWLRAWRLLVVSRPHRGATWEDRAYTVQQTLAGSVVLNADLHKAIDLLSPVLTLSANRDDMYGEPAPDPPRRLADLTWARLSVDDRGGAPELLAALVAVPQPLAILGTATAKLQAIAGLSLDAGMIVDDYDTSDFSVPSVEPHEQNDHHDGPVFLVSLLAQILPAAAEADQPQTRLFTDLWWQIPGMLGIRLWLHALRSEALYTADEAMAGLQTLPRDTFWHVRRELVLVLRDRAAKAAPALVHAIEHRILSEGAEYYARYTIEDGQPDWRAHARDAEVWLRLNMLAEAGMLSDDGSGELAAIVARRDYLDRAVQDQDFFGSYSSGVRTVVGDVTPIIEAADDERLQVARDVLRSPDIEKQQGWSMFCRTDPSGAFDTLSRAPLEAANAPLWADLISALSFPEGERDATRRDLVVRVFVTLEPAEDPFLELIAYPLANLYWSAPRRQEPAIAAWLPRLLANAVAHDQEPLESTRDLYSDTINSAAGRLTEALLLDIEHFRQNEEPVPPALIDAMTNAAGAEGRQGAFARAALIHAAGFVTTIEGQQVEPILGVAMEGEGDEARALRAVLVSDTRLSAAASRAFPRSILQGVHELAARGHDATAAAAKILAPPLSVLRGEGTLEHWGLSTADAARALRTGPPALREGAAELLGQWIHQLAGSPEAGWRNGIGPLLVAVWPRERSLADRELSRHFADLAVSTGDAFPEALAQLLPYLSVIEGGGSTYAIEKSAVPERFPRETLVILWKLFGPGSSGDLYGVPKILDRLVAALPAIELDRRLQWLEQRAVRYD
ncbi:SIR2 family protein [Sphingomonas sp. MG17]|uniref:SIR2 family protein n=1 Tax=Sphingomonas tagetis TaxID=2949092 RepID=A0A9X2KR89_9SPHN|nr:SIR2 family protein [Sphingomonas tagetis]MCP3732568.1 SIR2 family protein [Sphingomonas tagetis]